MARTTAHVLAVGIMLARGAESLSAETHARETCTAREAVPKQLHPSDRGMATGVVNGMARSGDVPALGRRGGRVEQHCVRPQQILREPGHKAGAVWRPISPDRHSRCLSPFASVGGAGIGQQAT